MNGMTLKQAAKHRFFLLCDAYRAAKTRIDTPQGKAEFVRLSLAIHAAKGEVPKRFWPLVNRSAQERLTRRKDAHEPAT